MKSGRHDDYYWVEWNDDSADLNTLLRRVPKLVLDRYLINTSFDSGSLIISEEERREGWRSIGSLTYSPPISDVHTIPHDQFDEWLAFSQPTEIQTWKPLVNYCGLSLTNPNYEWLQAELWAQVESLRPESYFADGDRLIFITRSEHLHELHSR